MGIIDHKFEIYGQRGDADGDFTDIIDEARSMADQMCTGLHSASPLYGEMIEAALRAFTEAVEWKLEMFREDEKTQFDVDNISDEESAAIHEEIDGYEERMKIIEYLDAQDSEPGWLFFGESEDIDAFDELWASGKKDKALDMIKADDQLGFTTLGEFKAFVENQ